MARKPPKIDHVKHVLRRGKWYSYFDTGTTNGRGQPIRRRLPDWGTVGFHDSYSGFMAGRTKRQAETDTVAKLVTDYLRSQAFNERAEATRASYKSQLKKVVKVWGKFPISELQPVHVRQGIEGNQWAPGTRSMVLAQIGTIYLWARQNDRTSADPIRDIKRPKGGEHSPWPEHVLDAALVSDSDTVRLAVHLLYFTGQRIGDVCAMRWTDIRAERIYVKQGKTGKVVEPPLSDELKAELDRTPKRDLLIMGGMQPAAVRQVLQAFTRQMGVKTVPHGLRKNAVIALLEADCTIAQTAAITGQTHQMVEYYAAMVNRRKLGDAAIHKLDIARKNKAG